MPPPLSSPVGAAAPCAPPSRRNVAVLCHAEYVPTLTAAAALRVKAAPSKAASWPWPLTFWPWKLCPSHVWRGLPLPIFGSRHPAHAHLGANLWRNNDGVPEKLNYEIGSRDLCPHLRADLCFTGKNCQGSVCVPDLKSVASTVCEILTALLNFEIGSSCTHATPT